ncbi:hypothetical protein ACET3Z_031760 [Daucus carota]
MKIGSPKMNSKLKITNPNGEHRLSSLLDELIYQVLSFLGTRQAVQTSIHSKRWKRMWTTLPVLSFDGRLINYPIDHNVEELDIDLQFHRYKPFKLSTFSSDTLKKLKLRVPLDYDESLRTDSEWVLPALKALHLIRPPHMSSYKLSEFCLIWLPNLTTPCLDGIRLPESLSSISVPCLTTLIMKRAKLPEKVWDLPDLLSLELDEVDLPANMTDFFSALGLHYDFVIPMLSELGNARTLTLDSAMIEVLYTVSNHLGRVPSPFKNLKYVKLPQGNKESGISTTLRKYLLGGNPRVTIVTSLPQPLLAVISKPSRPLKIGAPEMNSKLKITNPNGQDRLSSLPDELIHQILSFLGTRQAVQTSILSKRWKRMWTSLPVLSFDGYDQLFPYNHSGIIRFIDHVLENRDQDTHVSCFKFLAVYPFPPNFVRRLINYTIDHNVEELDIDFQFHRYKPFKLSTFSSDTLKKLKLRVPLDYDESLRTDSEWVLPALKALHLIRPPHMSGYNFSEYCLIWLPNLTTLCLDGIRLPESLSSISVPCLTTLIMKRAKLPENVWDLPALLSLELD